MVFRHEAPETRVSRIMTVVTHHPVIIHLEGVFRRFLSVDVDFSVFHLQAVALVVLDRTFIHRQVIQCQVYGSSLLRNPYRTVVIYCPARQLIIRIQSARIIIRHVFNGSHQVLPCQQSSLRLFSQRHVIYRFLRVISHQILLADAQFMT